MDSQSPDKTCPQCGATFTCGVSAGESTCWCFDLPNVISLDDIGTDDAPSSCLCPDCLRAKIEAHGTTDAS